MAYAKHIGRVGGLAVALGVGMAVAPAPGVAFAAPAADSPSTTDSASGAPSTSSTGPASTDAGTPSSGSTSTDDSKPKVTVGADKGEETDAPNTGSSGSDDTAADTSAEGEPLADSDTDADTEPVTTKRGTSDRKSGSDTQRQSSPRKLADASDTDTTVTSVSPSSPKASPAPKAPTTSTSVVTSMPATYSQLESASTTETISAAPTEPAPTDGGGRVILTALALTGLTPMDSDSPAVPSGSPAEWAVLAATRRLGQSTSDEQDAGLLSSPKMTSQSFGEQSFATMSVAANSAPTASPAVGAPNDANGVVNGSLNATDPDGGQLTYTVAGAPTKGTVAVNSAGTFTYTPTQAARLVAGQTPGADTDSFTVNVSDGEATQAVTVTVPISSLQLQTNAALPSGTSTTVGNNPSAVVVTSDGRMFVANTGSNTVSVINTATGQRIDANSSASSMDITVGSSPSAMVLSADGSKLYVANTGSNTVSVINTGNYQVIDANGTASGTAISVGSAPSALALGSDGRLYVANRTSNTVSVINTANYQVIDANGTAAGTAIAVGATPTSIAVSPDGSLAYVANGPDTVSVIDTKTNTVMRTVTIEVGSPVETGGHVIALSSDGSRIYVSDAFDRKVRSLSLVHVNTAPQRAGDPIVTGTDPNTGAVTALMNVNDIDGDKLTYATATGASPAAGAVTYNAAAGTYTYTPTQAAREAAWGTSGDDYDHFSVAASDGQGGTITVPVTVTISAVAPPPAPGEPSITPVEVISPSAVVVSGTKVYVVNEWNNTVTVMDTTSNAVVAIVPVGANPTSVAVKPDGTRVYVTNYDENTVSVIDTFDYSVATINVPYRDTWYGVSDVTVSDDGSKAYVINELDNTVSVIDTATNSVSGPYDAGFQPSSLTVSPDGRTLYIASYPTDSITVLDTATMAPVGTNIALQNNNHPVDVAVSPDGHRLYVVTQIVQNGGIDSAVAVVDIDPASPTRYTVVDTIAVSDTASAVAFNTEGNRAYVTHAVGNTITVIDTDTNEVIDTFTTDQSPSVGSARDVAVGADGTLYVTDSQDNMVYVIDFGATL